MKTFPISMLFYGLCTALHDDLSFEWLRSDCVYLDFLDLVELRREKVQEFGCVLGIHGCSGAKMLFLAAEKSVHAAYAGYPRRLSLPDVPYLTMLSGWDERILLAADALGWPEERRDLDWWLTGYKE